MLMNKSSANPPGLDPTLPDYLSFALLAMPRWLLHRRTSPTGLILRKLRAWPCP
jgi:hypothetical protein